MKPRVPFADGEGISFQRIPARGRGCKWKKPSFFRFKTFNLPNLHTKGGLSVAGSLRRVPVFTPEFPMQISTRSDLCYEPFSRRGSYLNLQRMTETTHPPSKTRGLWLRHCHGHGFFNPLLAEIHLNGGEAVSEWDEAVLTLRPQAGGGEVRVVFDGTRSLRFLGAGCAMTLTFPTGAGSGLYAVSDTAWEVNARAARQKMMLTPLAGRLSADTDWHGENSSRMAVTLSPGDDPHWELALDLFTSTWVPRGFRAFADCEAEVRADFAAFLAPLPETVPEFAAARVRAAWVNWSALVEPCGHFRRPAMLMSKNYMSNVWSWDHAFNAMAHFSGDPQTAWDQMLLMADRQNEHGAFPDAQNDVHEHFNFCKPPIHGWAVSRMLDMRPDFFTPERIRETIGWLEPWTRWWLNHRNREPQNLPLYLHGNDSGWDNSTFFLKGVPVLTPDLPCFLALQCQALAELHGRLGRAREQNLWDREAGRLVNTLLDTLWDGERFHALRLPANEKIVSDTLIETMPLVLGDVLPENIRAKVLQRLRGYLTPHGPATEHPDSPHYTPDGYWRGPIWAPSTFLLVDGLRRAGETELAEDIALRFVRMCAASGFAENFNALTGEPLRDKAYTWTSSVFLLLMPGA